jgi:hypothetical protein
VSPDLIALVIIAALPYADRALDKHYASQAAARKHELAVKALAVKAGAQ